MQDACEPCGELQTAQVSGDMKCGYSWSTYDLGFNRADLIPETMYNQRWTLTSRYSQGSRVQIELRKGLHCAHNVSIPDIMEAMMHSHQRRPMAGSKHEGQWKIVWLGRRNKGI